MSDISPARRAVPPRAVAALLIALVAIVGGVAGAAIDRVVVRRNATSTLTDTTFHPLSQTLRAPTDADRRRLREQLSHELNLSPAQDSTIDSIMNRRAGEFNAIREELRPRVERLVLDVRADIEQVLTPDQRLRFRALQQARGTIRTTRTDLHASETPAVAQP